MNERPTPRTDAARVFASGRVDKHWIEVRDCRTLERELDELRDRYNADTLALRAERDEARHKLDICMAANSDVKRIAAERDALRDALRVRIDQARVPGSDDPCGLCGRYIGHNETCRHAATEREVMQ